MERPPCILSISSRWYGILPLSLFAIGVERRKEVALFVAVLSPKCQHVTCCCSPVAQLLTLLFRTLHLPSSTLVRNQLFPHSIGYRIVVPSPSISPFTTLFPLTPHPDCSSSQLLSMLVRKRSRQEHHATRYRHTKYKRWSRKDVDWIRTDTSACMHAMSINIRIASCLEILHSLNVHLSWQTDILHSSPRSTHTFLSTLPFVKTPQLRSWFASVEVSLSGEFRAFAIILHHWTLPIKVTHTLLNLMALH
ncbi:hypothetical protein B0O80DRAFT_214083 [Mortierella sp. GBAus27b]|nr:hypothetical protein B0O80DRAFT_214083 [Mortierella sp. GBAus27b]